MSSQQLLLGGGVNAGPGLFVDEVFSTFLYEGNNSDKTITNNINLSDEGGLVWLKNRKEADTDHALIDTVRGAGFYLRSNQQYGNGNTGANNNFNSFTTTGFTLKADNSGDKFNANNHSYSSWSFRRASKFFDVVTYTGGNSAQNISHSLACVPGLIIVKATSETSPWVVYHRSLGSGSGLFLNLDNGEDDTGNYNFWNNTAPTSSVFTVGVPSNNEFDSYTNKNNETYIAYLFAHDEQSFGSDRNESIIKCGSFTTDASGDATIDLGWEPSFVIMKRSDGGAGWYMFDTLRDFPVNGNSERLEADTDESTSNNNNFMNNYNLVSSSGFSVNSINTNSAHVFIAIRRADGYVGSPKTASKLFAMDSGQSSTYDIHFPNFISNFPVDFALRRIDNQTDDWDAALRILTQSGLTTGSAVLRTNEPHCLTTQNQTGIDYSNNNSYYNKNRFDSNTGWDRGSHSSSHSWMWSRHGKSFDIVHWDGNGSATDNISTPRFISHGLNKEPEMIIIKKHSTSGNGTWKVWHKELNLGVDSYDYYVQIDSTAYQTNTKLIDSATSSTQFGIYNTNLLGGNNTTNLSGDKYVAFLFSSVENVSRVGRYSGSSSTTDIDITGFGFKPRFIMIRRIMHNGSAVNGVWSVFSDETGVYGGTANDPRLELGSDSEADTDHNFLDFINDGIRLEPDSGYSHSSYVNKDGSEFIYYAHG